METVRQLDDDNTDILCHGKEHLPQVLRLDLQFILGITELSQLGHAVHKESHLFAELPGDILQRHVRVFHCVVQHSRHDSLFVHLQVRKDDTDPERMYDIGFARLAYLVFMCFLSDPVCLLDQGDIRRRMVFPDPCHQRLVEFLPDSDNPPEPLQHDRLPSPDSYSAVHTPEFLP